MSTTTDNVGLIFPVYFLLMPKMVASFAKKLKIKDHQYLFCVTTSGGDQAMYTPNLIKF